ncbi:MAG: TonB family protein [Bdellovibrionota bacterium]
MMTKRHMFWIAIAISMMLHLIGGLGISLFPGLQVSKPDRSVEVELIDPDKVAEMMKHRLDTSKNGEIVQQDEKRLNDEIPVDSKYLSRNNQKVVQETQAKLNGRFKNTNSDSGHEDDRRRGDRPVAPTEKQASTPKPEEDPEKKTLTAENGVAVRGKKPSLKDLTPSFRPSVPTADSEIAAVGGGEGQSASDDRLKNVKTGMQTLLSTREFVYYSYYNRIREKLRQYWEPKIKEKFERIVRQGRTIASDGDKITRIIIILDEKGTLTKVQVVSGSGVRDLDDAAVEAFRAAAPFPNPPKGIVEADGTIKIRWDFVLEANAGGLFDLLNAGFKTM